MLVRVGYNATNKMNAQLEEDAMAREQIKVPFGYEPQEESTKGTVIVCETFEDWTELEVKALIAWAEERKFVRVILYPQHEETLRRMDIRAAQPYYARVKHITALVDEMDTPLQVDVDTWEGKRKKYTPLDTSFSFLTEKSPSPHFICMSDRYANLFVTYPSFKEWIKKARLVIFTEFHVPLHGKLKDYEGRWETVDFGHGS
ncbi:hypothetical protein [Paenibacillus roseipurpureus]|uniref:Uncharacterized protein n=1 Tax=Paenibacillus roseopurpureus TaxID=2918901 RepID=A0AA96LJF5_9BACL|nr:hypothetical protein [Paenibacillus sp. MBLB1832]WNR42177.1 hypothetical protein MJB10_13620 [Paenibacillus sp. MBLB1832]